MTPEQVDRVKIILSEALVLPEDQRQGYLDTACRNEPTILQEVVSLLAQEGLALPILEQPVLDLLKIADRAPAPAALEAGQRIGAYQILKILGEGGMGTVALARREHDFQKEVALKVIRPDEVSEDTLRRFENERQLLAQLDHPNIARILDGGTTDDGQPYFVMEHVDGLRLDRYCERREPELESRLKLFLQICAAVQVAHQRLIVHRDLKPSNILVTADGVPKLLDFGIAKRLGADAATRTSGAVPMTLRYASPEQIDPRPDRPITTASDIYSLGGILYQLLTGQPAHPAEGDSFAALVRAICEHEPPLPSTVVDRASGRRLAGDLDSIAAKALRKDPRARYGSVEQLADDVNRYLTGQPVLARKGNLGYQLGKLVRRNWGKLLIAALLALVVLGGTVSTTVLWRRAVVEQARGEEVLSFLQGLFKEAQPDRSDGEALRALDVLARGERDIDRLEDPLSQAKLLDTIGDVYTSLKLHDRALAPRERCLTILRRQYPGANPRVAKAINDLASTHYRLSDLEPAETLYREALAMKRSLEGRLFGETLTPTELDIGKSMSNLATLAVGRQAYGEAEVLYREALRLRIERDGPTDIDVATSRRNLAHLLYTIGRFNEAEALARPALDTRLRHYGPEHTKTATARFSLGRILHATDRASEAEIEYRAALEIRKQRYGEDSRSTARLEVALAALLLDLGRQEESLPLLQGALKTLSDADGEGSKATRSLSTALAEARSVLGALRAGQDDSHQARNLLTEGHQQLTELEGESSTRTQQALRRLEALTLLPPNASEDEDRDQPSPIPVPSDS